MGIVLTVVIILGTAVWAFSFSQIYTRPHTRAEASRWIYHNLPGALTLHIDTDDGAFMQPLPYRAGDTLASNAPFSQPFISPADGLISAVQFEHILDRSAMGGMKTVLCRLSLRVTRCRPGCSISTKRIPGNGQPPRHGL